ncbi:MAG: GPW/gp25 family protein [Flavobacteriales bacterium]|nr:GPW/gp25 family protein [Flavobacteriales bacterium]
MSLVAGYKIPMNFDEFFTTKRFQQCSIQESIASYVHLLVITTYEEFEFDPEFGCDVWDYEFEHQQSTRIWIEQLGRKIRDILEKYESRLNNIQVKASISQAEFEQKEGFNVSKRLKKKLHLQLTARLSSTNESFRFEDNILLSPFSTD